MRASQGDTIVELVLAFAIFSLAAVGTMAVINNGVATTQRDLETSLVREQVDAQAEMIRYIRDTKDPAWASLISNTVTKPLPLSKSCQAASDISRGFYIQPIINTTNPESTHFTRRSVTSATYTDSPDTYAKIDYASGANRSQGIWIQVTRAEQNGPVSAYDFYIHACWNSVGVRVPLTAGTIVRMYE